MQHAGSPLPPHPCVLQYAQILACRRPVALHHIYFRQTLCHTYVAVVWRTDTGQHGCPFGKGHVSERPVQFGKKLEGQRRCAGAYGLQCAEVVGAEAEQFVSQLPALCHDEVIVEKAVLIGGCISLHHTHHLIVIAETIFGIYPEYLFILHLRFDKSSRSRPRVESLHVEQPHPLAQGHEAQRQGKEHDAQEYLSAFHLPQATCQ